MKKFAKMSLVAALAVAGTTASAQPLAEAIKNVDVSGTVAYRYNDYEGNVTNDDTDGNNSATNNYKIALNLKSKVNDDVTANTRFIIGSKTGEAVLGSSNTSDTQVDTTLSEVNFTYTGVQNLAVTVGKQAIDTPWTVARDSLGNESTGTGAVASYTAGPVTLVGAYFNQTNLGDTVDGEVGFAGAKYDDNKYLLTKSTTKPTSTEVQDLIDAIGSNDIYVLGAAASFAGVNLDAFYANMDDIFDSYTIGLGGSFDISDVKLAPFARYSQLEAEKNGELADLIGNDDQKLWQIGLTANMGIFEAFAAYGEAGSDGGFVFLDSGSATNMDYHWRVTADGSADTKYTYVHATADVTDTVNVGLFYSEANYKNSDIGNDTNEVYGQVAYQMSKNLSTYVRYGVIDVDGDADGDMGRVHVQYSF